MSSILNKLSILERLPSHQRMTARDNAGKKSKKPKKHHYDEHFNKDWDKSILERLPSSQRMREHDEAGKRTKKSKKKKHYEEHFNKDWDADLWD